MHNHGWHALNERPMRALAYVHGHMVVGVHLTALAVDNRLVIGRHVNVFRHFHNRLIVRSHRSGTICDNAGRTPR